MAAAVPIALFAAGGAMQAGGAKFSANAAAQAADYNAGIARQNAAFTEQQTAEQERQHAITSESQIGAIRANYGASGVTSDSGSALDVVGQSARNSALDALNIQHAGDMKAWSYMSGASLDTAQAANDRVSGDLGAANAIFGAGTKAYASGAIGQGIGDVFDVGM